jgi:hypothetical protein
MEVGAIETEAERRARERANLVAAFERSGGKVYGPSAFGARAAGVEKRLPPPAGHKG